MNKKDKAPKKLIGKNIFNLKPYGEMPEHGTIVAVLSEMELAEMTTVSHQRNAIEDASDAPYAFCFDVRRDHKEVWSRVVKTHNLNPAWPLAFDWDTGYVYIHTK